MLTGRSYKDKKAIEEVIEEVEKESGKQFDPDLVKEFLQFLKLEDAPDEVSQRSKEEDKKEIIQKTINGIITSF
jgi:HD-GYP domain-containing protein (c-di-GMP phosphodiesterase class II)